MLSETFEDADGNVITDQDKVTIPRAEYDRYHEDPCYPNVSEKDADNEKELILG